MDEKYTSYLSPRMKYPGYISKLLYCIHLVSMIFVSFVSYLTRKMDDQSLTEDRFVPVIFVSSRVRNESS